MSKAYQPTAEQLALAAARKAKKRQDKEKAEAQVQEEDTRGNTLTRNWLPTRGVPQLDQSAQTVKVMTWNLLAQTLVRRELFPASDCLKASQREHMINKELISHNADICCLQEVDRTEKLFPVLKQAGYACHYQAGPRKKHGCAIAYREDRYIQVDDARILYDEQEIRVGGSERARRGSSFLTKNIANMVALKRLDDSDQGFIVATTHLFWRPRCSYERARQVGILFREVAKFRDTLGFHHWPCIIAGDFNFQPDDAAYSLLVGDALTPSQTASLDVSRVIHVSLDPSVPVTVPGAAAEEDEGAQSEESDPDNVIKNTRRAQAADGLLSDDELRALFDRPIRPVSAYDRGLRHIDAASIENLTFGSRVQIPDSRHGAFEPVWTSYTHYWKTVLDYIFVLDPFDRHTFVSGLASPFSEENLAPGIPRKGVCGSDHISLSVELSWPTQAAPRPSSYLG